jgi:hypothetical protein
VVEAPAGTPLISGSGPYTDSLGDPPLDTYEAILRHDADPILDAPPVALRAGFGRSP